MNLEKGAQNIPTYIVQIKIDLEIINQSRNPNWTDDEIYRLLELLQEKEVLQYMKDNRTRNVSIFYFINDSNFLNMFEYYAWSASFIKLCYN